MLESVIEETSAVLVKAVNDFIARSIATHDPASRSWDAAVAAAQEGRHRPLVVLLARAARAHAATKPAPRTLPMPKTPPNDCAVEVPALLEVAEDDRVRAAVVNVAIDWFLDGGAPADIAKSTGIPEAAIEEAIRWRLRRVPPPGVTGRPKGANSKRRARKIAAIEKLTRAGKGARAIALELGLAVGTVRYYRKRWL